MRFLLVFIAAIICTLGMTSTAQAQSVGPKQLCDGPVASSCTAPGGSPKIGEPVYYEFELYGGPAVATLDITENYPPSFVPLNPASPIICSATNGPNSGANLPVTIVSAGPPLRVTVDLDGGQDAICRFAGTFVQPGVTATNTAGLTSGTPPNSTNTVISSNVQFDADLTITKTRLTPLTSSLNISGTPGTARYRIEVSSDQAVYLGEFFRVYDQLALFPNGTAVTANLQAGSTCSLRTAGGSTNPIAGCTNTTDLSGEINTPGWQDIASWGIAPGALVLLEPGDTLVIEYEVEFAVPSTVTCVLAEDSEGIRNRAFLGLAGASSALSDADSSNNDTVSDTSSDLALSTGIFNVDPDCNAGPGAGPPVPPTPLTISKTARNIPSAGLQWGMIVQYEIEIENTSSADTAYDIELKDVLSNLAGTPNFTAQLVNTSLFCGATLCTQTSPGFAQANPSLFGTAFGAGGPITAFTSYYDRKQMWTGQIPQLAPNQRVRFSLRIRLDKPTCDFAPLIENKLIRNTISMTHKIDWTINDPDTGPGILTAGYSQSDTADVKMVNPPACAIKVEKTAKPGKNVGGTPLWNDGVIFNGWKEYEITFSSLPPTPSHNKTIEIGTLIDAIRIENAFYATGLNLDYDWACADVSGGGVRGFDASGSGSASVNHVGQPHQGVRVMSHSGVVEFDPGASLKCDVRIKVQRPDPADPYCLSDGQPYLQNLALMDGSRFFNANMPWPHAPQGMSWDATSDKLANCFNLVINKVPSTGVVSRNGGPVGYTITVTNANRPGTNGDVNFPDSDAGTRRSPSLTDMFYLPSNQTSLPVNAMNLNFAPNPCTTGTTIKCNIYARPSTSQHVAEILRLPAQQSLQIKYTVDGPFEPHQFCNRARGFAGDGRPFYEAYFKNYNSWVSTACVLVRGSLQVEKTFDLPPWVTMAPSTQFDIEVECDAPSGFNDFTRNLAVSPGNPSALIDRIVIGSECEIEEANLPDAAQWGDCEWEDPAYPAGRKAMIDGLVEPHMLSVVNKLTCAPTPTQLSIKKELLSDPSCIAVALCTFRITVTNSGSGYHSGPVEITDTFANGPVSVGYDLGPVDPHQWDWQCNQGLANTPIDCAESDLQLGPGDTSYFDMTLDIYPAGTNCAVLETPAYSPKLESCVDVGDVYVDTTSLSIEKFQITPGTCDGTGAFAQNCTFEFIVTNNGTTDFNDKLTIRDTVQVIGINNQSGVTVVSNSAGWTCTQLTNSIECKSDNPVSIPAGGSITVSLELDIEFPIPPAGNCATLGNTNTNGDLIESCVDFIAEGGRGDHAFQITKEMVSDPKLCSYLGNKQCTFRIELTYTGTSTWNGTLTITDIYYDQVNNALLKTLVGQPTNGWTCPTTSANPLHDCYKMVGPMTQGDTESFDITFDLTGTPPTFTRNCARLESPALTPRPTDCVALGQQLFLRVIQPDRGNEATPDTKPRERIRFPEIKIDLDGLFGRKKKREDDDETEKKQPE
ncbi:MAG: DUF5979 domain-containing protein [Pseudomonadota bacterium]